MAWAAEKSGREDTRWSKTWGALNTKGKRAQTLISRQLIVGGPRMSFPLGSNTTHLGGKSKNGQEAGRLVRRTSHNSAHRRVPDFRIPNSKHLSPWPWNQNLGPPYHSLSETQSKTHLGDSHWLKLSPAVPLSRRMPPPLSHLSLVDSIRRIDHIS